MYEFAKCLINKNIRKLNAIIEELNKLFPKKKRIKYKNFNN